VEASAGWELSVEKAGKMKQEILGGWLKVDKDEFGGVASQLGWTVGAVVWFLPFAGKDKGMVELFDNVTVDDFLQLMEVKNHAVGGGTLLLQGCPFDGDK
jgi:hypothetical protein